jgi:hypothetical protein
MEEEEEVDKEDTVDINKRDKAAAYMAIEAK